APLREAQGHGLFDCDLSGGRISVGRRSVAQSLRGLAKNGTTTNAVPMYSFAEFNKLIGFEDVWEFERRYAESE
ncbi:MAG: hypothetical protein WCF76_12570, partial [Pseudolabrys sp.]